jgi:cell division protein FtsW (lipid II flippase)
MRALSRIRATEFGLLLPAAALALGGASILLLRGGRAVGTATLAPTLAVLALLFVAHLWLTVRLPTADQTLLPLAAILTCLGLTVVARIEPALATRQLGWLVVSLIGWAVVIGFPRPVIWLARYRYTLAILGIGLLAVTMVAGVDPNGSGVRIWLGFGGYYLQPSELIKVLLVIFLAAYLDESRELLGGATFAGGQSRFLGRASLAYFLPVALMCGVSLMLFVVQKDLGPAFLFMLVTLSMLYLATGRLLYPVLGFVGFAVGATIVYQFFRVAQERVSVWLDPWKDAADRGYQIIQGIVAFSNGGVFGVGLGYGHPEILPAAHTDFPYAVIGEELGLFGAMGVLGLFVLLALRGYAVAARSPGGFHLLLAAGLTTVLAFQATIIMAGTLKMLPLTGITLPFVSYGGSSLLTNYLVLGLLHRISAEAAPPS